ncbi:MAG: hypothetical protein OEV42_00135 [Deltaproteobacteria bacterium]|nr:hypothetical protein [Deltaproteobacteria bacterium]
MVRGFNHNIKHKGKIYHIQTEDSGIETPHIITLLYVGGTILAREKTSYADIIKVDNLETVVKELMEEQHKGMLKKLIAGGFDEPAKAPPPPNEKTLTKEEEKEKFGQDVISDKGLDEVILDFLSGGPDK